MNAIEISARQDTAVAKGMLRIVRHLSEVETRIIDGELRQDFLEFCCGLRPSELVNLRDIVLLTECVAQADALDIIAEFMNDM